MASAVAWNESSRPATPVRARGGTWSLYLILAVALAPIVVPAGPGQTAILDLVNLLALPAFAVAMLLSRRSIAVPFLVPVFLIGVGSLIATIGAESPRTAVFTMLQDVYLFAWFVMVVNLLRDGRDGTRIRKAWMWIANGLAFYGLFTVLTHGGLSLVDLVRPKGMRALATFTNPNMFADYLVVSFFIVLSLGNELGRLVRWGSLALLLTALIATKSNGGIIALGVGLAAWALARAWTLRLPAVGLLALAMLGGSLTLGGYWVVQGTGFGASELEEVRSRSVLRRAERSSEGRMKIWGNLARNFVEKPAGIGPGNSRWVELSIEERVRRESLLSKEAHNDYLAYLVERGPLGLLGLLALKVEGFILITRWWRRRTERGPGVGGAVVAAVIGGLVATSVHSLTVEALHFRHTWLFLAVLCALDGMTFRWNRSARDGDPASEPELRQAAVA